MAGTSCLKCRWDLSQCHLPITAENSNQMPPVTFIKDQWSDAMLSVVDSKAFYQVRKVRKKSTHLETDSEWLEPIILWH